METSCYTNEKYNFLRIYDTRGIEISKDFDILKVFDETLKDIKEKCEKNEPNELFYDNSLSFVLLYRNKI